ncbi:MAG: hypothetical protein AAF703_22095 [Cyanobacteria bacterium P01_D01_bin.105]
MHVDDPTVIAYQAEQDKREQQQDEAAEEWGFVSLELAQMVQRWGKDLILQEVSAFPENQPIAPASEPFVPLCKYCTSWQAPRLLKLSDGTTYQTPGYCQSRAAAELEQMPDDYAKICAFFQLDCPF